MKSKFEKNSLLLSLPLRSSDFPCLMQTVHWASLLPEETQIHLFSLYGWLKPVEPHLAQQQTLLQGCTVQFMNRGFAQLCPFLQHTQHKQHWYRLQEPAHFPCKNFDLGVSGLAKSCLRVVKFCWNLWSFSAQNLWASYCALLTACWDLSFWEYSLLCQDMKRNFFLTLSTFTLLLHAVSCWYLNLCRVANSAPEKTY